LIVDGAPENVSQFIMLFSKDISSFGNSAKFSLTFGIPALALHPFIFLADQSTGLANPSLPPWLSMKG
jgi:hypothetical protein